MARHSKVFAHHAASGWNPHVPLYVPAARSLREVHVITVASRSSTVQPVSSRPRITSQCSAQLLDQPDPVGRAVQQHCARVPDKPSPAGLEFQSPIPAITLLHLEGALFYPRDPFSAS